MASFLTSPRQSTSLFMRTSAYQERHQGLAAPALGIARFSVHAISLCSAGPDLSRLRRPDETECTDSHSIHRSHNGQVQSTSASERFLAMCSLGRDPQSSSYVVWA